MKVDDELARKYGGDESFTLNGQIVHKAPGAYYVTVRGRGCVNGASGFDAGDGCDFNNSRWFSGANETFADPNQGNPPNFSGEPVTNFTNAGRSILARTAMVFALYLLAD